MQRYALVEPWDLPAAPVRIILLVMATSIATFLRLLKPKRPWLQFSLGAAFVTLTLLCVGLGLVVAPAARQRRAVAAIVALDGEVWYADRELASEPRSITFLRRWLPRDYFDRVQEVRVRSLRPSGDLLGHLQELRTLQFLRLDETELTDAGLARLQDLQELEKLDLEDTKVSDNGLATLARLTRLKVLNLEGTRITDAGLAHLQGLKELQTLWLGRTRISGAGLGELQGLKNLQLLGLNDTLVTNDELVHVQRLSGLRILSFRGAPVTAGAIAELRQALPNCSISGP